MIFRRLRRIALVTLWLQIAERKQVRTRLHRFPEFQHKTLAFCLQLLFLQINNRCGVGVFRTPRNRRMG